MGGWKPQILRVRLVNDSDQIPRRPCCLCLDGRFVIQLNGYGGSKHSKHLCLALQTVFDIRRDRLAAIVDCGTVGGVEGDILEVDIS